MNEDPILIDYLAAQTRLKKSMMKELHRLIDTAYQSPADRDAALETLPRPVTALVRDYRQRSRREAQKYLARDARARGYGAPVIPPDDAGYAEQAARTVLNRHLTGEQLSAWLRASAVFDRHVRQAGREAVIGASELTAEQAPEAFPELPSLAEATAEIEAHRETPESAREQEEASELDPLADLRAGMREDRARAKEEAAQRRRNREAAQSEETGALDDQGRRPFAWARVLTGAENCAFCIMLAARGPVYKSEASASSRHREVTFYVKDRKGRQRKRIRRDRTAGDVYHDNCDCLAVPVYTSKDWPGKRQYEAARAFYEAHAGRGGDVLQEMQKSVELMEKRGWSLDVDPVRRTDHSWEESGFRWPPDMDGSIPHGDLPRYRLNRQDKDHIWVGERGDVRKGGHRPGLGRADKTEFPPGTRKQDAVKLIQRTLDEPDIAQNSGDRWTFRKEIDGVVYVAAMYGDPPVFRTGYPEMGENIYANLEDTGLRARAKRRNLTLDLEWRTVGY